MSMTEWAKREVEIACKRENPDRKAGEFYDYACACYESALKAFHSLMEDGHSGMSIGYTKHILNRLIEGKPLSPIEDTEDIWEERTRPNGREYITYQCKRMSSLFKDVYDDGHVEYHDIDRYIAVYEDSPDISWHSGLVSRVIDEMYPITMPYMPTTKPFTAYCEELLTDRKNGDFDTIAILYLKTPEGDRVEVNRYFKEGSGENRDWTEIDFKEWVERCELHNRRVETEEES